MVIQPFRDIYSFCSRSFFSNGRQAVCAIKKMKQTGILFIFSVVVGLSRVSKWTLCTFVYSTKMNKVLKHWKQCRCFMMTSIFRHFLEWTEVSEWERERERAMARESSLMERKNWREKEGQQAESWKAFVYSNTIQPIKLKRAEKAEWWISLFLLTYIPY